jgi:hypothetical protein
VGKRQGMRRKEGEVKEAVAEEEDVVEEEGETISLAMLSKPTPKYIVSDLNLFKFNFYLLYSL